MSQALPRRGMSYLVGVLGLERLVSRKRALLHRDAENEFPAPPEDVRLALEEPGPTLIKIGQLLSIAVGVLAAAVIDGLAGLAAGNRVPGRNGRRAIARSALRGLAPGSVGGYTGRDRLVSAVRRPFPVPRKR